MSSKISCFDQNKKEHLFDKDELRFRPSAYGVVIRDGRILLSPQWDGFDIPGGGTKIDETVEQCVEREVWEETGLKVKVGEIIHCESSFFLLPNVNEPVHSILMYYLCDVVGGEITDQNFDKFEREYAKKAEWIDLEKVDQLKFFNSIDTLEIIEKAKKLLNSK